MSWTPAWSAAWTTTPALCSSSPPKAWALPWAAAAGTTAWWRRCGGKPTPGLGFGLGLDRILMALEAQQVEFPQPVKCEAYIASMGDAAQTKALLLMEELHRCGIPADCGPVRARSEGPDEVRRQDRRQVHHGAGGQRAARPERLN